MDDVNRATGRKYNYALLNFYENGLDAITAHRDNSIGFVDDYEIATLALYD